MFDTRSDLAWNPVYKILVILERVIFHVLTKSKKSYTIFSISASSGGWFIWEEVKTRKMSTTLDFIYRSLKYNCDMAYYGLSKADLNWESNKEGTV